MESESKLNGEVSFTALEIAELSKGKELELDEETETMRTQLLEAEESARKEIERKEGEAKEAMAGRAKEDIDVIVTHMEKQDEARHQKTATDESTSKKIVQSSLETNK